jgi:hypothetical protein
VYLSFTLRACWRLVLAPVEEVVEEGVGHVEQDHVEQWEETGLYWGVFFGRVSVLDGCFLRLEASRGVEMLQCGLSIPTALDEPMCAGGTRLSMHDLSLATELLGVERTLG